MLFRTFFNAIAKTHWCTTYLMPPMVFDKLIAPAKTSQPLEVLLLVYSRKHQQAMIPELYMGLSYPKNKATMFLSVTVVPHLLVKQRFIEHLPECVADRLRQHNFDVQQKIVAKRRRPKVNGLPKINDKGHIEAIFSDDEVKITKEEVKPGLFVYRGEVKVRLVRCNIEDAPEKSPPNNFPRAKL